LKKNDPILSTSSNLLENIRKIRELFKKNFPDYKLALLNENFAIENMKTDNDPNYIESVLKSKNAEKKYFEAMNPQIKVVGETLSQYITTLNDY
jgi:hypothetical protein